MATPKPLPKDVRDALLHLQPGEQLMGWTTGFCDVMVFGEKIRKAGVVLATETRLLLYVSRAFGRFDLREFPFTAIRQFTVAKGFASYSATFAITGGTCKISMMTDNTPELLLSFIRSRIGQPPVSVPPPPAHASAAPPPPPRSITVELEKLAELRAIGALSEEEFARAKAKLIG